MARRRSSFFSLFSRFLASLSPRRGHTRCRVGASSQSIITLVYTTYNRLSSLGPLQETRDQQNPFLPDSLLSREVHSVNSDSRYTIS